MENNNQVGQNQLPGMLFPGNHCPYVPGRCIHCNIDAHSSLDEHNKAVHKKSKHKCKICKNVFKRDAQLEDHERKR